MIRAFTPGEAAKRLHVSVRTIKNWMRTGKLRGTKLGGKLWRVLDVDLDRFVVSERCVTYKPTAGKPHNA